MHKETKVFWDKTPCRLVKEVPAFRRSSLPQYSWLRPVSSSQNHGSTEPSDSAELL